MTPRTLYQRIVDAHRVCPFGDGGQILLYVDRQVLNEYASPQASNQPRGYEFDQRIAW